MRCSLIPQYGGKPTHPRRANTQDETGRLKKRVAELESIIREVCTLQQPSTLHCGLIPGAVLQLKNKPHPRWALPEHSGSEAEDLAPSNDKTNNAGPSKTTAAGRPPSPPRSPSAELDASSPPSPPRLLVTQYFSSPIGSPSPLNTPSPMPQTPVDVCLPLGSDVSSLLNTSDCDFSSLLASYQFSSGPGIDEAFFGDVVDPMLPAAPDACASHRPDEHCGCLNEHANYQTVLELSLRLRRATEVLSRYAKHNSQSDCRVHRGVSDLDRFTT